MTGGMTPEERRVFEAMTGVDPSDYPDDPPELLRAVAQEIADAPDRAVEWLETLRDMIDVAPEDSPDERRAAQALWIGGRLSGPYAKVVVSIAAWQSGGTDYADIADVAGQFKGTDDDGNVASPEEVARSLVILPVSWQDVLVAFEEYATALADQMDVES